MTQSTLLMTFTMLIPTLPKTVGFVGARGWSHLGQSSPIPPTLPASSTPRVQFACLQKGGEFIPRSVFCPPSLPFPLCNPEELALYSEQEKAEGGRGSYEGCTPPRFYFLLEDCVRCRKQLGQ